MLKNLFALIIGVIMVTGFPVIAVSDDDQDTVYGWEIMSKEERSAHREKISSLKTEQEREAYRIEHHEKMKQRAAEMGVELPEVPLQRGDGMNRGGSGMGGMGSGPHR